MTVSELWCDGGVIGVNPSPHGGTWAYCWVGPDGECAHLRGGVVRPTDIGLDKVSNNVMELWAALEALASVPVGWRGPLHSDSKVTLARLHADGQRFNGIPNFLRLRALELRRSRRLHSVHVKGHPTKLELSRGVSVGGLPVSRHNVRCDEECQRLARDFLASLKEGS